MVPPNQKALAMGVANFGTNFANIIGPGLFIWIATTWSWQTGFAIIGLLGFLWVPLWLTTTRVPRAHRSDCQRERTYRSVLKYKQAWGYSLAKGLTDPVWWFYLFWLPTYLTDFRGMTPGERATALTIVLCHFGRRNFGRWRGFQLPDAEWLDGGSPALGMVVENTKLAALLFGLGPAPHQA